MPTPPSGPRVGANPAIGSAVTVDGRTFERIPIRTRVLMPGDDIAGAIREFAGPVLQPGDTVVLSESAVAIMQGRARDWRTIHPTPLARWLAGRVLKTSYGTGLRSPYAMQYAIELCGLPRILLALPIHAIGRLLGRRGWFYLVAGLDARMMDAEHTMGVEAFHEFVIPAPADPPGTVRHLKATLGYDVAICDINDISPAWCVASTLPRERQWLLERSYDDNPLGQTDQQTPIGIWREAAPPG
ncbi:MAG TPA: coenzyme F420-0:L-glutamate ligase [Candidatus Limnocylindrales bacterium]